MFRTLAIAAALVGAMSVARADVYKWTDPDGHVQYSDQWRPGSVLIKTTVPSSAVADSEAATQTDQQKLAASDAAVAQEQAQRETEQTVKQDVAASKAQQCKQATEAYQKAIQSRRMYKQGQNGEREYVSDQEADAYRAKLLAQRKEVCGK
jgi:Domain of unknown function (DUF4124)